MIWAAFGLTFFRLTVRFMMSARRLSGSFSSTFAPKEEGSMERM
jgi:hypothetical protein